MVMCNENAFFYEMQVIPPTFHDITSIKMPVMTITFTLEKHLAYFFLLEPLYTVTICSISQ